MNNMKKTNWGYLPDYSNQNWTLRTPRVGSWNLASGSYAKDSEKIPVKAWFGLALVLACMFAALFI